MDSIDIADLAFSLASSSDLLSSPFNEVSSSIPDINKVISSVTDISDDSSPGINIYLIVGFILLIGGLFLYSYFTNRAKKVTFDENVENYYNSNS
jgi:hypothetical protein|uniref:Uncharacterized protein n=1 Tax=viral metagenome TaxID=1070528 RepID=A0A6C0AS84_9ZZZZ